MCKCDECEMLNPTEIGMDWYGITIFEKGWHCGDTGLESIHIEDLCQSKCRKG